MTITDDPITRATDELSSPIAPHHPPIEIAADGFVIQATQGAGQAPVAMHLDMMVIRGSEPIVVDTGVPAPGQELLDQIIAMAEPAS